MLRIRKGAEVVRNEIEANLLSHAGHLHSVEAEHGEAEPMVDDYRRLIRLAKPQIIPNPSKPDVMAKRHLIRHEADVPVLLSAIGPRTEPGCESPRRHNFSKRCPHCSRNAGFMRLPNV
jgi:hypothetical protein